jgi:hypothetical protein
MQVRRRDIKPGAVIQQAGTNHVRIVRSIEYGRATFFDSLFGEGECLCTSMVAWANWPLKRERIKKIVREQKQ